MRSLKPFRKANKPRRLTRFGKCAELHKAPAELHIHSNQPADDCGPRFDADRIEGIRLRLETECVVRDAGHRTCGRRPIATGGWRDVRTRRVQKASRHYLRSGNGRRASVGPRGDAEQPQRLCVRLSRSPIERLQPFGIQTNERGAIQRIRDRTG
jgi:hypothetical protein